jgi:V/A-type H+/Na+-transporting ATPase subunit E
MTGEKQPSGVKELIQRLREEGVTAGSKQAQALLEEARVKAEDIIDQARREAELVRQQARADAQRSRTAGEEAIRLAVRDAILTLRSEITEQFAGRVRRLVAQSLDNEAFIKQLILEVVHRAPPARAVGPRQVLLPSDVVGLDDLRRNPEKVKEGTLSHLVLSLASDMLRDGVSFGNASDEARGIRVKLTEEDVQIDLTERAIADLLLRHLLPRFRALLEGVVQ